LLINKKKPRQIKQIMVLEIRPNGVCLLLYVGVKVDIIFKRLY